MLKLSFNLCFVRFKNNCLFPTPWKIHTSKSPKDDYMSRYKLAHFFLFGDTSISFLSILYTMFTYLWSWDSIILNQYLIILKNLPTNNGNLPSVQYYLPYESHLLHNHSLKLVILTCQIIIICALYLYLWSWINIY